MKRARRSVFTAMLVATVAGCGGSTPARPTREIAAPAAPAGAAGAGWSPVLRVTSWSCFSGGTCERRRIATAGAAAAASAPGAPGGLTGSVTGTTVTLTWSPPSGSDPAASYVVEAGSSSGASDLASFDTGSADPSLTVPDVPAGVYYVRVRARNAAGTSAASNQTVVTVGQSSCSRSDPPTALTSSVSGSAVTLNWTAPASGGCTPSSYTLEAGSASGASDLANFSTGSASTSFSTSGVPDGTYFLRMRAQNAFGISAPSGEIIVTVGVAIPSLTISGPLVVTVDQTLRIGLGVGQTSQLTATATLANGTTQAVTSAATWTSSTGAASVSALGVIAGVGVGSATITATYQGRSSTLLATVGAIDLTGSYSLSFSTSSTCAVPKSITSTSFKMVQAGSTATVTSPFYVLLSNIGTAVSLPILSFQSGWSLSRFTCGVSGSQVTCPESSSDSMGILDVGNIVALHLENSLQVIGRVQAVVSGTTITGTLNGRVGQLSNGTLISDCTATDHRVVFTLRP